LKRNAPVSGSKTLTCGPPPPSAPVTIGSGADWIVVSFVEELFPESESGVAELTWAVLATVVPEPTRTTSMNDCGPTLPGAGRSAVAVTTPEAVPGGGAVTTQPGGAEKDTKVVFAGNESVSVTDWALLG